MKGRGEGHKRCSDVPKWKTRVVIVDGLVEGNGGEGAG